MKNDISKYNDQYAITRSFKDQKVILHGTDPLALLKEAKEQGIDNPVVFFVTDKPLIFGHGTYTEHHSE